MGAIKRAARPASTPASRKASRTAHSVPDTLSTGSARSSSVGQLITSLSLAQMDEDEGKRWLAGMRTRLAQKMVRERAYLDRRAARRTHTPTDEVYEADQLLEAELLALLDELMQRMV